MEVWNYAYSIPLWVKKNGWNDEEFRQKTVLVTQTSLYGVLLLLLPITGHAQMIIPIAVGIGTSFIILTFRKNS